MTIYEVILRIEEESLQLALQTLGVAIKQKFKKERGPGIRRPENWDEAGARWKR